MNLADPAFRHGYLGESGRHVLNAFSAAEEELTRAHVLMRTSGPVATVDGSLKRLVASGLLDKPKRGVYRRTDLGTRDYASSSGADLVAKRAEVAVQRQRLAYGRFRLEQIAEYTGAHWITSTYEALSSTEALNCETGQTVTIDDIQTHARALQRGQLGPGSAA